MRALRRWRKDNLYRKFVTEMRLVSKLFTTSGFYLVSTAWFRRPQQTDLRKMDFTAWLECLPVQ